MDTRHTVLAELLVKMGADENPAAEDAGRIERVIRETSFDAVRRCLHDFRAQNHTAEERSRFLHAVFQKQLTGIWLSLLPSCLLTAGRESQIRVHLRPAAARSNPTGWCR